MIGLFLGDFQMLPGHLALGGLATAGIGQNELYRHLPSSTIL